VALLTHMGKILKVIFTPLALLVNLLVSKFDFLDQILVLDFELFEVNQVDSICDFALLLVFHLKAFDGFLLQNCFDQKLRDLLVHFRVLFVHLVDRILLIFGCFESSDYSFINLLANFIAFFLNLFDI
jgi:hypothetical protein